MQSPELPRFGFVVTLFLSKLANGPAYTKANGGADNQQNNA